MHGYMTPDTGPVKPLNLREYAARRGLTTRAVRYQLAQGRCEVTPFRLKPPRWHVTDLEAFERSCVPLLDSAGL